MSSKKIVIAISGASGAIYGIKTSEILKQLGVETHLILSTAALKTIKAETAWQPQEVIKLADYFYEIDDIGAAIASGSFKIDAMMIVPCSMQSLACIAHGIENNLITRAAAVNLKERRPLIMMVRETPFSLIHLQNMLAATQAGAVIAPAAPSFYHRPKTIDALVEHTVNRLISFCGIDNPQSKAWLGMPN